VTVIDVKEIAALMKSFVIMWEVEKQNSGKNGSL